MQLAEIASASEDVGATSSRLAKRSRIAELLAATPADEVPTVVAWLSGELPQRQIGVGWAALRSVPPAAPEPSLTVAGVHERLDEIKATTGTGSQARRRALLADLFAAATPVEQTFLRRLLGGELRQGALLGVMADAVAAAAEVPAAAVRRAAMLGGALPAVAAAAITEGEAGLATFRLQVGRPVGPMLAQTASDVADALERLGGRAVFEAKLDGARVQIHRDGDDVRVFTRSLDDVTSRLPEVVQAARALPVRSLIADGEAIALRADGRPERFQVTASRFGRGADGPAAGGAAQGLSVFFFDLLHVDGEDLLDHAGEERAGTLQQVVPESQRVERLVTDDPAAAQDFLERTLAAGHEGVMAKSLDARYEAGRRGAGWLKVKPVHTLDLVVLAIEWGSGRRTGKLSNIHLGARDAAGGFVMLGKTFKGMTDAMLAWQTDHFLALETHREGHVVHVRPEQVVEIAFDGLQRSTRYPGGVALRFARVLRYREDKTAAEADTLETVHSLYGSD